MFVVVAFAASAASHSSASGVSGAHHRLHGASVGASSSGVEFDIEVAFGKTVVAVEDSVLPDSAGVGQDLSGGEDRGRQTQQLQRLPEAEPVRKFVVGVQRRL